MSGFYATKYKIEKNHSENAIEEDEIGGTKKLK